MTNPAAGPHGRLAGVRDALTPREWARAGAMATTIIGLNVAGWGMLSAAASIPQPSTCRPMIDPVIPPARAHSLGVSASRTAASLPCGLAARLVIGAPPG